MDNLKNYREKELKNYIVFNIFVLLLFSGSFNIQNFQNGWFCGLVKILESTLISSSIYVFAFLADSLFSNGLKMKLLYIKGHLPGETVFSDLKKENNDLRFTKEELLVKYKDIYLGIPIEKKEKYKYENSCWWKIYNKHRNIPMILISNRDYLLCRDLYISTGVIIICYFISCYFTNALEFNWKSILYLGFMILITNISAHIKGKRFVLNVLAYDLQN